MVGCLALRLILFGLGFDLFVVVVATGCCISLEGLVLGAVLLWGCLFLFSCLAVGV